jgi:hypothetical protein
MSEFVYCTDSECSICDGVRAGVTFAQMVTGDLRAFAIDLDAALADRANQVTP